MIIFLSLIFFSIVVAVYANNKKTKISPLFAFLLSFLLSPIVGFIIVAVSKPDENKLLDNNKKCPECAEMIKKEAKKCKHCSHLFEDQ